MPAGASPARGYSPTSSLTPALATLVERFGVRIRKDAERDRLVLPSVPASVLAVREKLRDPDAGIDAICATIGRDPTLAARLLRVANSPAFAGVSPCNTLHAAVVRLGNAVVENVMLILTISRVFSVGGRAAIQPHLARLWAHSTRVAALCEVIASEAPHLKRDVALLAGLVHDIGKVPLLVKAQEFPSLFNNPMLLDHLVASLHAELGAVVLESWNGPPELTQPTIEHHQLGRDVPGPADYADLVLVANLVSHLDASAPDAGVEYGALPAFRKLGLDATTLPEIVCRASESEAALQASVRGS